MVAAEVQDQRGDDGAPTHRRRNDRSGSSGVVLQRANFNVTLLPVHLSKSGLSEKVTTFHSMLFPRCTARTAQDQGASALHRPLAVGHCPKPSPIVRAAAPQGRTNAGTPVWDHHATSRARTDGRARSGPPAVLWAWRHLLQTAHHTMQVCWPFLKLAGTRCKSSAWPARTLRCWNKQAGRAGPAVARPPSRRFFFCAWMPRLRPHHHLGCRARCVSPCSAVCACTDQMWPLLAHGCRASRLRSSNRWLMAGADQRVFRSLSAARPCNLAQRLACAGTGNLASTAPNRAREP
jgi:hypothetical protein